jgi:NDP-sugar pyrophosphorylase family protein
VLRPADFFDLSHLTGPFVDLFDSLAEVWLAVPRLELVLRAFFQTPGRVLGHVEPGAVLVHSESVYVGKGAVVESGAYIRGPAYLGADCCVRHGAYLRGNVMAGPGCVLGHASEFKNALLLDGTSAAHFAYVGDSLLGHNVNLGAGTKLSNNGLLNEPPPSPQGQRTVRLRIPALGGSTIDTGLVKLGAILGDGVRTGCNVVAHPGCLVGPRTLVYPQVSLGKGYWEGGRIIKLRQTLDEGPLHSPAPLPDANFPA